VVDSLAKTASEIERFVRQPATKIEEFGGTTRAATIERFLKDLEEMRVQYLEVQMTNVRETLAGLSLTAGRVSSNLPPTTIPPKPNVFYGRDDLVETIITVLLRDKPTHIPLLGTGGIGKTSVAAAVMNDPRIQAKYGKRMFFLRCEGVPSEEGIIQALAELLGIPPGPNARSAVLECLAAGGYTLLILDNLETAVQSADGSSVEQLLAKIAQLSGLSLMITMRGTFAPGAIEWEEMSVLPSLSLDAARSIWRRIARKTDDRLDELLKRLDGLPLAIH